MSGRDWILFVQGLLGGTLIAVGWHSCHEGNWGAFTMCLLALGSVVGSAVHFRVMTR